MNLSQEEGFVDRELREVNENRVQGRGKRKSRTNRGTEERIGGGREDELFLKQSSSKSYL